MAIHHTIDSTAGVITMTLTGDVTVQDFHDYFAASRNDPAFKADFSRLVLIRELRSFPRSPEVREIASRIRPRTSDPAVHIAVVADSPLGRGVTAMLMGGAGLADRYRLFDDATSAMVWLIMSGRSAAVHA
jgi:hypothetical protein